jgi:hypothetical protein
VVTSELIRTATCDAVWLICPLFPERAARYHTCETDMAGMVCRSGRSRGLAECWHAGGMDAMRVPENSGSPPLGHQHIKRRTPPLRPHTTLSLPEIMMHTTGSSNYSHSPCNLLARLNLLAPHRRD